MSKELSLDDIIQKKKTSIAMKNRGIKKPVTKNATKTANGASNHLKVSKRIEDARLKIIQIKRNHMVDARDKLAQMARLSDARLKLQKLRAARSKKVDPVSMSRKTGCTGQISLSTNKLTVPRIPRTVSSFVPLHSRPLNYRPTMIPEAHYVNEMIVGYNNDYLMDHQAALRRTVSNDYAPSLPPPPPIFNIKPSPYDWDKPTHGSSLSRSQSIRTVDQSRPRDYKVITRTGLPKSESGHVYRDDWAFTSKTRTILPDSAPNSKYYAMRSHKGDIGVKSRLESHPSKASRLTVNSSRSKSSSQTPGYRIVVSNLQPNVTQEDIKELFEDVGELLVSTLTRPGVAEVTYKNLKDATKAVETYHNRQLDGHPMKCLLVPPGQKTSSSTSSGKILSQSRVSSGYSQPSLGMVHRALFD